MHDADEQLDQTLLEFFAAGMNNGFLKFKPYIVHILSSKFGMKNIIDTLRIIFGYEL